MQKQWVLIEDQNEIRNIWSEIYSLFDFTPDYYNKTQSPFTFPKFVKSVKIYDISRAQQVLNPHDADGNYRTTVQIDLLKAIFSKCMGKDDFMYALDWQHGCFKYDPRINEAYGYYMMYASRPDTRAYFPLFFPDGDYFLFVSQNFNWGYFTHPWQKRAWVFGKDMVKLMEKHFQDLEFIECF